MSKVTTVKGYLDYINGYLRYAHFELDLNDDELRDFDDLTISQKIERLKEEGNLVIDDYRINDYGEITNIEY